MRDYIEPLWVLCICNPHATCSTSKSRNPRKLEPLYFERIPLKSPQINYLAPCTQFQIATIVQHPSTQIAPKTMNLAEFPQKWDSNSLIGI